MKISLRIRFCLSFCLLLSILFLTCKQKQDPNTTQDSASREQKRVVVNQLEDNMISGAEAKSALLAQKEDGEKYNIAIVRSGEYYIYAETLFYILESLSAEDYLESIDFSAAEKTTIEGILNALLAKKDYSQYLEFSQQLYFDFAWDEQNKESKKFRDIVSDPTVDIILSFGTKSSQVLSRYEGLQTPVLVLAVSDPVASGIVPSIYDSGKDNLAVVVDPGRFERQIRLFYNVVKFNRLGLIYNDTESGKSYAAWNDVNALAKEKNFRIISATDVIEKDNDPNAAAKYIAALKDIAPSIDALYLTIQAGLTLQSLPQVIEVVHQYKLPTFAMEGSRFVQHGVLFSISAYELTSMGMFNAEAILKVLAGEAPRNVETIFNITPSIAVNLGEAAKIGFDVPVDILASADEIYQK